MPELNLKRAPQLDGSSATTPGRIWRWQENSWETGVATPEAARWVSPWCDLGHTDYRKGGFTVYLLCEVQGAPVTLHVSIQTEKKLKTKTMTVLPTSGENQLHKPKRLRFGGGGRRWRLIIESPAEQGVWRLIGGVTMVADIDPD